MRTQRGSSNNNRQRNQRRKQPILNRRYTLFVTHEAAGG